MFTAAEDPVYSITLAGPDALRELGYYHKDREELVCRTELRYCLAAHPDLGALFLASSSFAFLAQHGTTASSSGCRKSTVPRRRRSKL